MYVYTIPTMSCSIILYPPLAPPTTNLPNSPVQSRKHKIHQIKPEVDPATKVNQILAPDVSVMAVIVFKGKQRLLGKSMLCERNLTMILPWSNNQTSISTSIVQLLFDRCLAQLVIKQMNRPWSIRSDRSDQAHFHRATCNQAEFIA